ncbi:MAG: dephospho-CoA kinase [Candidatus Eremiobacteraeota bacterium]|nr:dephospho-CoA kinase [Candidatus Eremiobacteraeota bacterium]
MRVGLTGGIGAGKSEVARIFEELGAFVIDTDVLSRDAVAPNSDGLMAIARVWPHVIRHGVLDRLALAEIIFTDPLARERLNSIVHPFVRRLAQEREKHARPWQLILHVVPLLFETGYGDLVDKSVVVVAPEDDRIIRIATRDRIDEAHARARMAAQINPHDARRKADFVIENDGNLAHLRERANAVYKQLTALSMR